MTDVGLRLRGVPAAPGVARGPWAEVGVAPLPAVRAIDRADVPAEQLRLRSAGIEAAKELRELAESVRKAGHEAESAIFGAQALMARDPDLLETGNVEIADGLIDAATAAIRAATRSADRVAALADERLRARSADILDVGARIARKAAGLPTGTRLDRPSVIVAEDLAPSTTATIPRELVLGILLERSSRTAHAAILARAYGIPAVVGAAGVVAAVRAAGRGVEVALDGETGEVIIDPGADDADRLGRRASELEEARAADLADATAPATTRDGVDVTLLANLGRPEEAADAVALGAAGVGLFRTEFLFLERQVPPTEDEQAAAYRAVIESFPGGSVTIRLLDIGGDKPIPYLRIAAEENPFLGVRALRLAAAQPDLFITQLRACIRAAAAGPVRVMAPMVADAEDVEVLVDLAARARASLDRDGVPSGPIELGVMLEIPSAILTARTYVERIEFASIGTNDLLQYTLAVDRGNAALERYRDPFHPAQLTLIRLAVEAADAGEISLSVCGEMAGEPAAALALVGLGIRALSMTPASLAAVRRAIRGADAGQLAAAAEAACGDASAAAARARFEQLLGVSAGNTGG